MLDTVTVKAGMPGADISARKLKVKQPKDQKFAQFLFPLTVKKQASDPEDEQSIPNIAALCTQATSIQCNADIQINKSVTTDGSKVLTTDAIELCPTTLSDNNQSLPQELQGMAVQSTNNETNSRLNIQSTMQDDAATLTETENIVVDSEKRLHEQNAPGSSHNFEISTLDNNHLIKTGIKYQQIHNSQSREIAQIKNAEVSAETAQAQDNQHKMLTPIQAKKAENPKQADAVSGNKTGETEKLPFDHRFQLEKNGVPTKSETETAGNNYRFVQEKSVFNTAHPEVYSGKENSVTTAIKNEPVVMQITNSIANNDLSNKTKFTMELWPEELGRVTVDMEYIGGKLSLSLIAENAGTSKLLSESISQLKNELSNRMLDVTNVDVQTGSSNTFADFNEGFRQHGNDNTANVRYKGEYGQGSDTDVEIENMQQFIKGNQLLNYLI